MLSHQDLTSRIIAGAFRVHNSLGPGHLEHVYQHALAHVLRREALDVRTEAALPVFFEGVRVGTCESDLIVNDLIVVETKAKDAILPGHEARLRAYLRASGYETGLVLNFGPARVDVRRVSWSGRVARNSG
ncbi:MAG: GxxExxY protein [Planctomycetia bacterium]|nr:GxxExxY protein [Planctomycetia bacterium]